MSMIKALMVGLLTAGCTAMIACEGDASGRAGYTYDGMWVPEDDSARPVAAAPVSAPAPKAQPKAEAKAAPVAPMPSGDGLNRTSMAFPTGVRETSAILLERTMPSEVTAGSEFSYDMKVCNLTNMTLSGVTLKDACMANATFVASNPPVSAGTPLKDMTWSLGDLKAGECKTVKVTVKPTGTGEVTSCATVTYNSLLCQNTVVVQPALAITKQITPEALICDPITMTVEVKNTGSGLARNVKITDNLPAGLTTVDGKNQITLDAGTLAAGQSKPFTVQLKAAKTGKYEGAASAMADGGLKADSNKVATVIRQPALALECKATGQVFFGRDVTFDFTLRNSGDAPCNATVSIPVPTNATFVRASDGGAASGTNIVWNFGALPASGSKTFSVTLKPAGMTPVAITASANCPCSQPASTQCSTNVVGIPALLLDGGDDPDPIQIGETTTYTLKVTNQGSANLTNVKLVCTMVDGENMQYVSSTGGGALSGTTITFPPIAVLAPKASMTFTVRVKAIKDGQVSFKAEASSTEITRPLIKTETTNFYK